MHRYPFLLLIFFLSLAGVRPTRAAVVYESVASIDVVGDTVASSLTVSVTCTNSDTALFPTAHIREGSSTPTTISALTYNGLTLANFSDVGTIVTPSAAGTKILTVSVRRALPGSAL